MIFTGTTAELRDAIVAGTDVTSPVSYPGKITLNQLNAFSGTLEPEALTNFKTLKVNSDGSVEETNVAKLLIDLQSGSGVEDAKEEAQIELDALWRNLDTKRSVDVLTKIVAVNAHVPSLGISLIAKPDFSYSFPREVRGVIVSAEAADGVITTFKPAAFYISAKRPLVFLNGVLQNGDEVEVDGGLGWSASFTTAPEEGSLVEFYFDDAVAGGSEISSIDSLLGDFADIHDEFQNLSNSALAALEALKADKMADKASVEQSIGTHLDNISAQDTIIKSTDLQGAESISDVTIAKDTIKSALTVRGDEYYYLHNDERNIEILDKDIAKINALIAEQMNISAEEELKYVEVNANLLTKKADIQNVADNLGY